MAYNQPDQITPGQNDKNYCLHHQFQPTGASVVEICVKYESTAQVVQVEGRCVEYLAEGEESLIGSPRAQTITPNHHMSAAIKVAACQSNEDCSPVRMSMCSQNLYILGAKST